MPNESVFPKSLMAAALSAAFPGMVSAQSAARVDFAAGNVTASTPDGRSRALTRGSEVQVGETVSTQQGRAQMRFTDGAYVSLQPQTDFRIDNYIFDGRGSANESSVMSLLKGGLRTITGLVGRTNRDGYRLQTNTATIGIRGTEYSVTYDAGGSVTVFVADGATTVSNNTGTTLLPGGKSATIGGQNSPPSTSDEKPFLPPTGNNNNTNVAPPQNPVQEAQTLPATLLTGTIVSNNPNLYNVASSSSYYRTNAGASAPAILDAQGRLTSFQSTPNGTFEGSGSAQLSLAGNDGVIAWGRWIGGVTTYGSGTIDGNVYGPTHWIVGVPATNMPTTGSASYSILGATASCYSGCSTAAVTSSTMTVNFGTSGVTGGSFNMGMNINSTAVTFVGSLSPSGGGYTSNSGFNTYACSGSGVYMHGSGFVAGPGASRAGMGYQVNGSIGEGPNNRIYGVVAYKKN